MKALIDGDVIVYSCGFASDTNYYLVGPLTFITKKEAKEFCDQKDLDYAVIETFVQEEPVAHCLHSAKLMLESICEAVGADEMAIYLTGVDNYRFGIYPEYKANRKGAPKPTHYQALRDYLVQQHKAVIVDGMEADDAMGIEQTLTNKVCANMRLGGHYATDSCICTIDKDLDMIGGWHYNWRKGDVYYVDEATAIRHFYTQLLTGDGVDNIPGLKGVGPKGAYKILDGFEGEQNLLFATCCAYDAREYGAEFMALNGELLWIRRKEDETWQDHLNTILGT